MLKVPQHFLADFDFCFTSNAKEIRRHFGFFLVGVQYTNNFLALKIENFQQKNLDIFLILAQNIDCGYTLEPPRRGGSNEYPQPMFCEEVLTCIHNLCFGAKKKRKIGIPLHTQVLLYKSGV